jgi:hypothetical protein
MSNLREKFKACKLPRLPIKIYTVNDPKVTDKTLVASAKPFGLKPDLRKGTFLQDAEKLMYTEGALQVTVNRASGAARYRDSLRYEANDGSSSIRFSKEEAEKIAKKFISARKLAAAREIRLFKISGLHIAHLEKDSKKGSEKIISMGVAFARTVDGIPVDGPGGKLVVHLDPKKEVTGCDLCWRKLGKVYRTVKSLQTYEFIEAEVDRFVQPDKDTVIDVTDLRFGYFENDPRETQKYLQPAFIIIMDVSYGQGERSVRKKKILVLPAATNHAGAIMPTPPPPAKRPDGPPRKVKK